MQPWNELLRIAREKTGFSQAALARAVGLSEQAVFSYEAGRRRPSREVVLRLARAMILDGATTNLILTRAGLAPEPSAISRSLAGLASADPRYRPGRWEDKAQATIASAEAIITAHSWPCLVLDSQLALVARNAAARRILGINGRFTTDRSQTQNLLDLLVSPRFREHATNYAEAIGALISGDFTGTGSLPALNSLLDQLGRDDQDAVRQLRERWQVASPAVLMTRATFPLVWRADDGTLLSFNGVLSLWSEYLWYWALDLHPADAATWTWLEQ